MIRDSERLRPQVGPRGILRHHVRRRPRGRIGQQQHLLLEEILRHRVRRDAFGCKPHRLAFRFDPRAERSQPVEQVTVTPGKEISRGYDGSIGRTAPLLDAEGRTAPLLDAEGRTRPTNQPPGVSPRQKPRETPSPTRPDGRIPGRNRPATLPNAPHGLSDKPTTPWSVCPTTSHKPTRA